MSVPSTGFYSLIQYCPDRGRLEAANIGVLLFCEQQHFLKARITNRIERIRHFFGASSGDARDLRRVMDMFANRIESEARTINDLAALRRFISLLANEIVVSEPKPVRVEEPNVELAQLFDELVAQSERREAPRENTLANRVMMRWENPELGNLIKRDVSVSVPVIGTQTTFPYAFQNGRRNLIDLEEYSQQRESDVINAILRKAAEGRLIYAHPDEEIGEQQMIVVGSLGPTAKGLQTDITTVMRDHNVQFFEEHSIEQLERIIVETAH